MHTSVTRRRWTVGGAALAAAAAAVAAVIGGAAAASGGGGSSYRTASVERADIDATLDSLGTIQPINQANLSFPVGGTVHSVSATVGQHVSVGQTLAQLDTASLDAQVAAARSAVSAAQARLAADQSSQTNSTVTAAVAPAAFSTESTSGGNTHAAGTASPDALPAAREVVTEQQARLIADQHRADQDLAHEKRDLTTQTDLCQALVAATGSSTAQVSANHPERHGTPSPGSSECEAAITTVLADQTAVDNDQQAVTTDLPALSAAIDKLVTTAQVPQPAASPPATAAPSAGRTARTTGSPGSTADRSASARATAAPAGGANRTAPTLRPATPEQLVSDQAAIDAAQAQLTEAQQAHDQAELHSPIDGTVGSLSISAGQVVPGSSANPQIVIIGPGAHQVTTSVNDTDIGSVRVGNTVTVVPSGSSTALQGEVVAIGLLATPGSAAPAGSVSYPVTIGLTSTDEQLFTGQSASVSIVLAHASGTLTVPSSAVHHVGSSTTVSVLRHGTASTVRVTLGVTGPTRTQVLAGLNPGDQVILADLSQPLPTSDIQNLRRATGGGGGRPGG